MVTQVTKEKAHKNTNKTNIGRLKLSWKKSLHKKRSPYILKVLQPSRIFYNMNGLSSEPKGLKKKKGIDSHAQKAKKQN